MKKVYVIIPILILILIILIVIFTNLYTKRPKVGDNITFGGRQWRVLEVQGLKAFIVSERIVEKRAYHNFYSEISWEKSSIREYLQNEYLDKAFTPKERKRITFSKNITRNNSWFSTYSGNDTYDKIVLLTIGDVVKYFGDSGDLKAHKAWFVDGDQSTFENGEMVSIAYIESEEGYLVHDQYDSGRVARDAYGGAWWWWTRTPGLNTYSVAIIGSDGTIRMNGHMANAVNGGVRPAMWVKLF